MTFCNESTGFDRQLNVMSVVVYDEEKHGTDSATFGCYKRKKNFARHRSPKNIKISKHTPMFKL